MDLVCQNIHLVSYRQVPGSIPGRGSIDFFPPPFLSLFWLGFPSVPFEFTKLANAQPSNFGPLRIFTLRFDDFFSLVEKLAFFKKWGYRMFLKAWHKSRWHNHLITIAHFASHSPLDFPFLSSYRVAPASGRIDKDPILLETQRAEKTMGKDNEIIQWLQNNRS